MLKIGLNTETLVNENNALNMTKNLGFHESVIATPINHQGGIWFLWNKDICEMEILEKNNIIITSLVKDPNKNSRFVLYGFYGPVKDNEKE